MLCVDATLQGQRKGRYFGDNLPFGIAAVNTFIILVPSFVKVAFFMFTLSCAHDLDTFTSIYLATTTFHKLNSSAPVNGCSRVSALSESTSPALLYLLNQQSHNPISVSGEWKRMACQIWIPMDDFHLRRR